MSKPLKVHSPSRTNKARATYAHSPYSLSNSPMTEGRELGSDDMINPSTPPAGVPIPVRKTRSFAIDTSAHSSHGNNSAPGSPIYEVYASYHSKGPEETSPLVVPSNFLNSNPSPVGSPPLEQQHSFAPGSYHSVGQMSNSRGGDLTSPPRSMFPPSSYAPVSFSPPNNNTRQTPFQGTFNTEPFTANPVLSRGFIDSYIGHSGPLTGAPSTSSASISNASSVAENLPLCPDDENCAQINEKAHQRRFAHTCRLFPCYHGHINRHAKLFRHAPGQVVLPEGVSKKLSTQALTSVTFSSISPEAPNAYRIYVAHQGKKYELFGDWENVKVHTFKRYLHQVCSISPASQSLMAAKTSTLMDDDISSVKSYGIETDSLILLSNRDEEPSPLRIAFDDL